MEPDIARSFDGHKYMWDGEVYDTREAAAAAVSDYEERGFEAVLVEEGNRFAVYSRRVVTEIVLEGEAPLG